MQVRDKGEVRVGKLHLSTLNYPQSVRHSALKRTMSTIALDEHDPFYRDDIAASDLLMDFVYKVKQDAQKPRKRTAQSTYEASVGSDSKQVHRKLLKVENREDETQDEGARTLSPFTTSFQKDGAPRRTEAIAPTTAAAASLPLMPPTMTRVTSCKQQSRNQ